MRRVRDKKRYKRKGKGKRKEKKRKRAKGKEEKKRVCRCLKRGAGPKYFFQNFFLTVLKVYIVAKEKRGKKK